MKATILTLSHNQEAHEGMKTKLDRAIKDIGEILQSWIYQMIF